MGGISSDSPALSNGVQRMTTIRAAPVPPAKLNKLGGIARRLPCGPHFDLIVN